MDVPGIGSLSSAAKSTVRGVLLPAIAPSWEFLFRYPTNQDFRQEDRAHGEAIAKDRLFVLLGLCLATSSYWGLGITDGIEAGKKRQRHTAANIDPDLTEDARVEIDNCPMTVEAEELVRIIRRSRVPDRDGEQDLAASGRLGFVPTPTPQVANAKPVVRLVSRIARPSGR